MARRREGGGGAAAVTLSTSSCEKKRTPPSTAVKSRLSQSMGVSGSDRMAISSPLTSDQGTRITRMSVSIQKRKAKVPRSFLHFCITECAKTYLGGTGASKPDGWQH